jgi:hypothetical protein
MADAGTIWSWTQPICEDCWETHYNGHIAHRLTKPETEVCVWCGKNNTSGIYIRVDPKYASYPTLTKEP